MYNKKTVIVTGAGASWHYGYPTGESLIRKVIERSLIAAKLFAMSSSPFTPMFVKNRPDGRIIQGSDQVRLAYQDASDECQKLADKLVQLNPLVIDYFLGHNPSLQGVGRFMIAWVLLECEAHYLKSAINPNRIGTQFLKTKHNDDWCRFVLHRMTFDLLGSRQLLSNKVHFITFNYDTSLDWHLYRTLHEIENLDDEDVDHFLGARIIHMYGSVRPAPVQKVAPLNIDFGQHVKDQNQLNLNWGHCKESLDMIYEAATTLKVIDPYNKEDNETDIVRAQHLLRDAEVVYFLGFGFDQNNCKRLGFNPYLKQSNPNPGSLLFTNFHDSGRVNKDAAKAFFGVPLANMFDMPQYVRRFDRSTRDVYDAFAMDFGSPEQD